MLRQVGLALCLIGLPGCAVPQLQRDQDGIRATLLHLYTDQVLDNLVRATNGLPIIQLDYTNASANITVEHTASLSDGLATTASSMSTVAAKSMEATTHQTVNTLSGSLGANNTNSVALTATPVLASDMLYNSYLTYLTIPGSLEITIDPPASGAAHVCKSYCGQYYWVPIAHKSDFFDLALIATTQRDRLLIAPDKFLVTLLKLDLASAVQKLGEGWRVDVAIDKSIPNEGGPTKNGDPRPWLFATDGVQPVLGAIKLDPFQLYQKDETGKYYIRQVRQSPGQFTYYAIDEQNHAWQVDRIAGATCGTPPTYRLTQTSTVPHCVDELVVPETTITKFYFTNTIRVTVSDSLFAQWRKDGLPSAAQIKLEVSRPAPPTTKDLLDRMRFRIPQIDLKPALNATQTDSSGPLPCETPSMTAQPK
jgi:hypothetical protein